MKRFLALLCVSLFLPFAPVSAPVQTLAEDNDFEIIDDEWDTTEEDEEKRKSMTESMDAAAGYDITYPEDGDFIYEPLGDDESCQVLRYKGLEEEVILPEKLGELKVTRLYQTFSDCNSVEKVTLPETVESIDNMTFWKCTGLTSVLIPEGVTFLGRCSFGGCTALKEIEFPDTLETIDEMVFIGCVELKEIQFGKNLKSIGSQAFTACAGLEKVRIPRGADVADDAFLQCPLLKEIEYYEPEG